MTSHLPINTQKVSLIWSKNAWACVTHSLSPSLPSFKPSSWIQAVTRIGRPCRWQRAVAFLPEITCLSLKQMWTSSSRPTPSIWVTTSSWRWTLRTRPAKSAPQCDHHWLRGVLHRRHQLNLYAWKQTATVDPWKSESDFTSFLAHAFKIT